jgi:hypothetical protein
VFRSTKELYGLIRSGRQNENPIANASLLISHAVPTCFYFSLNRYFPQQQYSISSQIKSNMRFVTAAAILSAAALSSSSYLTVDAAVSGGAADKDGGPPPFFLQDPADSLCLAGESFKRCSIDTLFYVVGAPGTYTLQCKRYKL